MNKIEITSILEKIITPSQIRNINIFGNEVVIDLNIDNPSLHAKKKLEKSIINSFDKNHKIVVNFNVEKKEIASNNKKNELVGIDNVIAISSGKGGVGKSTITSNLATSLSKMGFKVGILDSDIYGPSIPTMFDVESSRPASVKIDNRSMIEPIENYGVKILSIGFFTEPNQAVIWRGPMASKALNQMIFDTNWGELDFLLVDLPPGTGDIHLSIVQSIPLNGAIVVSTPQKVALADAKRGISMFNQKNIEVPVLGLIENMAYFVPEDMPEKKYFIFGKDGVKNLADDSNVPFLGLVPLFKSIREASDFGHPASLQDNSVISKSFEEIAKNVVSSVVERNNHLPPTKIVKITTMAGCSAIKKK
ncbi:MAG: Mrp/NBP35 family ATP-binding protein [Flavobacteriaceae bacterium]|tara:strand:- start:3766 stop:4854 length:1089 start_codon:yes stop_codon:yes gene_type:complete